MEDMLNHLLDLYRSNFEFGVIPHEDKLRESFYLCFGVITMGGGIFTVSDEKGDVILSHSVEQKT